MNKNEALNSLNLNSTLGEAMRVLYVAALDYCVLCAADREEIICLTKEQLVGLLERGYSENKIREIFAFAEKKAFKPIVPKTLDEPKSKKIDVLAISEYATKVLSFSEAFSEREPEYPAWWEVPLPLALICKNKITLNKTASDLAISKPLSTIDTDSLPIEDNEFFVTLKEKKKSHSVLFKQLAGRIFLIEDVTQDVATAGDMVWWASVGKTLFSKLENEGKVLFKEDESIKTKGDLEIEERFICSWDGKDVGKLCIAKQPEKIAAADKTDKKKRTKKK